MVMEEENVPIDVEATEEETPPTLMGEPMAEPSPVDEQPEIEPLVTEAAFLVYMFPDGRWVADSDPDN